ncbi:endonuclease/exonuclease/phosphatase family protein [Desulfosediminicola flagellatus]|uniref:endonuclease/exonuclease/phosphatase family protein n=1 Tax=Desulfosediminicola flagellatus TaxID=2569541 RepID=UPI0010AD8C21|nr:GMP synthase [Desulfosediminicola flagellatus]
MITVQKTTANIAAWNLKGYHGITDDRIEKQINGLAMLDAEVVALVEINPLATLEKIQSGLSKLGVNYQKALLQQSGKLHIGVLYKDGIEASNLRLVEGSDLGDPEKRKALVVDLKIGKFDCTLIVVHLKSGREKSSQRLRDEQAKVICKYIEECRVSGREDIILTGDFNMIPGQDISNFHYLGGDDVMDFISSWDLQERFSHIMEKGRANLLDGFAITRTFSKEYIRGSLRVFPMHWSMDIGREHYKDEVSDHLPFVATFRVDRDAD